MNPAGLARKPGKVCGQSATENSAVLQAVVVETVKVWRKHHLSYDQTKYVVEQTRRTLDLYPPRDRERTVERLSRQKVEQLIEHAGRRAPRYGLMLKTLFYSGARVSQVRPVGVNLTWNENGK